MNLLLHLSILLLAGLLGSFVIKFVKLPDVTGYLILGLLVGPSVLGLLDEAAIGQMSVASDIALAFIAFTVGGEFKLSYFKRVGATPIVIAVFESFFAVGLVVAGLLAAGYNLPFALCLGSIAAATAPAATVMVIKQYHARGPVTECLLSVVAIDDATALIAFGVATSMAKTLESGAALSLYSALGSPLLEVGASLLLGFALGCAYTFALRFFKEKGTQLTLTIAFILLGAAVADELDLSALLLCMMFSATFTNLARLSNEVYSAIDRFTPPIFCLFFVLSGADLKLSVLPSIGVVGVIYVVLRVAGKWIGAALGARLMHADANIQKYLGPALLPQAGVAIGLSFLAQQVVPQYADTIRAVILCGTLIYELIGPAVSKTTLQKAGEIEAGA